MGRRTDAPSLFVFLCRSRRVDHPVGRLTRDKSRPVCASSVHSMSSSEGLEDIVAATSSITLIDGIKGRLLYRGYDISDLAQYSSYEETYNLLWDGRLP